MAAAVTVVAIEGLSDEQRQALSGVKVGDMVLFQKRYEPEDEDDAESEASSDDEDAGAQDEHVGGEEGNGEEDDDSANSVQASVNGGEDSDDEAEAEENVTEPTSEEEDEDTVATARMYLVSSVITGEDGAIADIGLVELQYAVKHDVEHGFQVYGTDVNHVAAKNCTHDKEFKCVSFRSVKQLSEDGGLQSFTLHLNLNGDLVRFAILQNHTCPAGCEGGWLKSLDELKDYIHHQVYVSPATLAHRPVCPVCLGLDLLQEQQTLRVLLEANQFDIGGVVDFIGRLNVRRRVVGHRFYQFDEREWGMEFDDMDQDSDDDDGYGGAGGNGGAWEQWAEAMDPNANVQTRPASDAAIAALPKMAFKDAPLPVEGGEKATACAVCQEDYDAETMVAVSARCGHFLCGGACTEQWLKQFDNCPTCRKRFTVEEDKDVEGTRSGDSAQDNTTIAGAEQEGDGNAEGAETVDVVDREAQEAADVLMSSA